MELEHLVVDGDVFELDESLDGTKDIHGNWRLEERKRHTLFLNNA